MNIIIKQKTTIHEVLNVVADKPAFIFGKFMEIRKAHGLSTKTWENCFNCSHKFAEDEEVYFGCVSQKGNIFFCKACAEKFSQELNN